MFLNFLKCNFVIAIVIFSIYLLTRIFKKFLSAKFKYALGLILLISLFFPFLPLPQINVNFLDNYLESEKKQIETYQANLKKSINNSQLLDDNQESISRINWDQLNSILFFTWVFGMFFISTKMLYVNYKISQVKKYSIPNDNPQIKVLLDSCLQEMEIKRKIPIRVTSELTMPGIVGFYKPCILFPKYSLDAIPLKNLRFILFHELQHYRHKDILINYLVCIVQILYWFNPFVRWAMKYIRQMQEVFCDVSVLDRLDSCTYYDYGNALVDFAELISKQDFSPIYNIGGSYEQIRMRILTISYYQKATLPNKVKDILLLILTAIVIFCSIPSLGVLSSDNNVALPDIKYNLLDYSSYFDNYNGCFVLYNTKNDSYSFYNIDRCQTRVSPDSTYKLYSALAGLENSIITPDDTLQSWSGEQYSNTYWNSNQTLQSAMANSVNWYFQNIDRKTGYQKLQDFFDEIAYGNKDLTGDISNYWLESTLLISPLEQVQLLTDLWQNKWGFDDQNIRLIKKSIFVSESKGKTLYGKTGTGNINDKCINGWFIGSVDSGNNTLIFATNISGNDNCDGRTAADITLNILSDLNIY